MADNSVLNTGSGGDTYASNDIGGIKYQRVKAVLGAAGTAVDPSAGNGVSGTGVQRVTIASDSTGQVSLAAGVASIGILGANAGVQIGDIKVNNAAAASSVPIQGAVASAAANGQNPVKIGAVFTTVQPTVSTTQVGDLQMTAKGALIVASGADTFTTAATVADGADVTLGAQADAAALTGTHSLMSFIKGLLTLMPQALGGHGALIVEGVASGTAIPVSLASAPSTAVTNAGTFAVQATLQSNTGVDIGKLTANQSVNVAQVNGVTTLMGAGATGTGSQRVTPASGSSMDAALGTAATNAYSVGLTALSSGGYGFKSIVCANSNNKTAVKASPGQVYKVEVYSIDSAPQYVKFFNAASASVTAGTTDCDWQIMVPANATAANGAGVTSSYEIGVAMGTAITILVTAAIGTHDNTSVPATKSIVNVFYQ